MTKEIENFLKNERDISEYKISLLQARKKRAYTDRLIASEKEYLAYPFLELELESKEDFAEALTMFRSDRTSFKRKYGGDQPSDGGITKSQISSLEKKILYLEDLYKFLIEKKIRYINLVDDEFFSEKYDSKNNIKDHNDLRLATEGAMCGKERARAQILVCCLSRFFYKEACGARDALDSGITSRGEYLELKEVLGSTFSRAGKEIFRYYNDSIFHAAIATDGTVGENSLIPTIYPLANIFDGLSEPLVLERKLPLDRDLVTKTGRPIRKKFIERAYSIRTPINRIGSESLGLLFCSLFSDSGICLDPIINRSFYNLSHKGSYYKAISTLPFWAIDKISLNPYLQREYYSLVGISDEPLLGVALANNPELAGKLNSNYGSVSIDSSLSKILIAATRTESDRLSEAKIYIDLLINKLEEEYQLVFGIKSPPTSSEGQRDRRNKVKDIIRSIFND